MSPHRVYPEATAKPCSECPWRRGAASGYLGPYDPRKWIRIALTDSPIACHKTIVVTDPLEGEGSWDHPKIRQCAGAAIFRANVGKSPKNPTVATGPADPENVFDDVVEFCHHHGDDEIEKPIGIYLGAPTEEGGI
jgi:hypothetical protein